MGPIHGRIRDKVRKETIAVATSAIISAQCRCGGEHPPAKLLFGKEVRKPWGEAFEIAFQVLGFVKQHHGVVQVEQNGMDHLAASFPGWHLPAQGNRSAL